MIEALFGPIISALSGLAGVAVGWWLQERSRQQQASFEWRLARYEELMARLSAFYEGAPGVTTPAAAAEARESFLEHFRRAWLYAPDDVVRAGQAFLGLVSTGASVDESARRGAALAFVVAMRKDLRGRTGLSGDDFQFWSASSGGTEGRPW
jgi:hypothetical protein